jgi:hypothetical protein
MAVDLVLPFCHNEQEVFQPFAKPRSDIPGLLGERFKKVNLLIETEGSSPAAFHTKGKTRTDDFCLQLPNRRQI